MNVVVNAKPIKALAEKIVAHIYGVWEDENKKRLEEIKERHRKPSKFLWFTVRPGVELTDDEAIEIAELTAAENNQRTWKCQSALGYLTIAKNMVQACELAMESDVGEAMVTINEHDLQTFRWFEGDFEFNDFAIWSSSMGTAKWQNRLS